MSTSDPHANFTWTNKIRPHTWPASFRWRLSSNSGGSASLNWLDPCPLLDGSVIGRVMSYRDVTPQMRSEANLGASELRLKELSVRNPLTNLFNRRHGAERLSQDIVRARRSGKPLSAAVIDIDHFKRINDQHGHQTGDQVLIAVAEDLKKRLRQTDTLRRRGGEEFLVILADTGRKAGMSLMDELRQYIGRPREDLSSITISIGVASLAEDHDADSLFCAADRRMFHAKRAGRNRVA